MTAPEIHVRPDPPPLVLPSAGTTLAGMVAGLLCGVAAYRWTGSARVVSSTDTIPDLFKTTINVTGDLSIAAIVARRASPEHEVA